MSIMNDLLIKIERKQSSLVEKYNVPFDPEL